MLSPRPDVSSSGAPPWRQSATLAILASLNLAGGLAMQWYVIASLGAGVETDALFASLALPQALLAIVASSFMTLLVPLLSGEDETVFRRNAWTFTAATAGIFSTAGVVLVFLAPWWVPLLTPGLPLSARTLAVQLARIQLLAMVCTSMAGILGAVGRARMAFIWVECAPLLSTLVAAAALVVTLPIYGIYAAAWTQVVRIGLHAALLSPGLGRFAGFTRDRLLLREAWRRLRPLVAGTAYVRTEPLFDRGLSSLAPTGDLSLYYLCQQVCTSALQLANNALIAPLVPRLAQHAKAGDWTAFSDARRHTVRVVALLSVAGACLLLLVIVAVVVVGWLPDGTGTLARRVGWIIAGLSGLLIAGPIAESFRSAFYATGITGTPVRIDAVIFTCGLALKFAGFAAFGVIGLAVAASCQALLSAVVLRRGLVRAVSLRVDAGSTPSRY